MFYRGVGGRGKALNKVLKSVKDFGYTDKAGKFGSQ